MEKMPQSASPTYKDLFHEIEKRAQENWRLESVYFTNLDIENRPRRYVLGMFPYPSGNAHMGHVRVYSIVDALARLARFKGCEVLNPLGWDAFGLPAENAARQNKLHPAQWTIANIRKMRDQQICRAGFSFDLTKEIDTSSPEFYKWTQWLFLKLYEHGLVYRSHSWVNWDPVDETVLANEQVIDGKGWRSGVPIERRQMEQWFIRITSFAEDLWSGLDDLDGWSPQAIAAQRSWIGKSEGVEIDFQVAGSDRSITVFTTRPDTVYGVTALVLAPEYEGLESLTTADRTADVRAYIKQALSKSEVERQADAEKTGVRTGHSAINPLSGQAVPIFVSDYVLGSYGTGAVMSVPAHDQRDFLFAQAADLPIRQVIIPPNEQAAATLSEAFEGDGIVCGSGPFDGMSSREMRTKIGPYVQARGTGRPAVTYRLRDWSISRQRFWGCPIPMIQLPNGAWEPVPEEELPVTLPRDLDLSTSTGASPLAAAQAFVSTTTPAGVVAKREVDTMDTFMCSAWYAWRFLDPHNDKLPWRADRAAHWMPITAYVGGLEHANLHLIYFRFMSHFLHSIGLTPTKEPVPVFLDNGIVRVGGAKMSKSKGNAVTPNEMIDKYGADALRLYILSDTPFDRDIEWSEKGLGAKQRFLAQVWRAYAHGRPRLPRKVMYSEPSIPDEWSRRLLGELYVAATTVEHIEDKHNFHVAVAQLHAFGAKLDDIVLGADTPERQNVVTFVMQSYLKLLAVFAPHIADTLWRETFESTGSLFTEPWVSVNMEVLDAVRRRVEIPITINGRRRFAAAVPPDISDNEVIDLIQSQKSDEVTRYTGDRGPERYVVVRDANGRPKLVNIVVQ